MQTEPVKVRVRVRVRVWVWLEGEEVAAPNLLAFVRARAGVRVKG